MKPCRIQDESAASIYITQNEKEHKHNINNLVQ
jgi:hypothetical protein